MGNNGNAKDSTSGPLGGPPDRIQGNDQWDVVVIGGGPPAEVVAQYATQFSGLSSVMIEKERVGGECEYWACRPSKALLVPIETRTVAADQPGLREIVGDTPLNVAAVMARRDAIAMHYDDSAELQWMNKYGIDLLRGHGQLTGPKSVSVTATDGTVRTVTARHAVVLSTGTQAAVPPIEGLAAAQPWISRDVTAIREVPRRVAVVGGGPVACEAVAILHGLGAEQVTLVHRGDRVLAKIEPFAGDIVLRQFRNAGVTVLLNTSVTQVARQDPADTGYGMIHGGTATLTLSNGDALDVDEIVIAIGRKPNSGDLGLDTVGVSTSHGFVDVDDHLTVPGTDWLYAIGDLTGRALLTHMGKYQGRVAGEVITARALGRPLTPRQPYDIATTLSDRTAVPQVVFTDPPVAAVGMSEAEARGRGMTVETAEFDLAQIAGSDILREHYEGRAKFVVDSDTDTLIGATFVGSGVVDLLHSATVAIVGTVPVAALWHAVPSFPTISEIWLRLLETLQYQRRNGRH